MLYRRKNALTRHNAVAHTRKNRAMAVAFLANLRQLHHYVTTAHDAAYRQLFEVDTAYENIFTESADSGITAACVKTTGKTGVEMEALTGVQIALLTIYDMCKAVDKAMVITDVHLLSKAGGKSGDFVWKQASEA